jgi:anthranilate phosphoribosyltransferase
LKELTAKIMQGEILSEEQAGIALSDLLSLETSAAQAAAFLTAIQMREIHLSELRGFHKALGTTGIAIDLQEENLIDVCGTGGDGKGTFNISTLTAFVLAGAGIKVAKHGNFSATSGCGSSDILLFLGVKFTADEEKLRSDLAAANICYLHAPLFQPGLKQVAPLRSEIGFRTFFNLLGPLINPARPRCRFIGVAEPSILRLYRYFLEDSGIDFAIIHARDGYDEISLTGPFDAATNEGMETIYPGEMDFETVAASELDGGANIEEAADSFLTVLRAGETKNKTHADVVIANAAFAMRLVMPDLSLAECKTKATESLSTRAAFNAFELLSRN